MEWDSGGMGRAGSDGGGGSGGGAACPVSCAASLANRLAATLFSGLPARDTDLKSCPDSSTTPITAAKTEERLDRALPNVSAASHLWGAADAAREGCRSCFTTPGPPSRRCPHPAMACKAMGRSCDCLSIAAEPQAHAATPAAAAAAACRASPAQTERRDAGQAGAAGGPGPADLHRLPGHAV